MTWDSRCARVLVLVLPLITVMTVSGGPEPARSDAVVRTLDGHVMSTTTPADNAVTVRSEAQLRRAWADPLVTEIDILLVRSYVDGSDADGPSGAIFTLDGDVAVLNSTLIGNRADDRGGAISGRTDPHPIPACSHVRTPRAGSAISTSRLRQFARRGYTATRRRGNR